MTVADVRFRLTLALAIVAPLRHAKHYYCDDCKEEFDKLYRFEGEELCGDCVLKRLEVVE